MRIQMCALCWDNTFNYIIYIRPYHIQIVEPPQKWKKSYVDSYLRHFALLAISWIKKLPSNFLPSKAYLVLEYMYNDGTRVMQGP